MPWQDMAGQGRHGHAYDLNKDEMSPLLQSRPVYSYEWLSIIPFSKASYQIWASESFPYASPATESA